MCGQFFIKETRLLLQAVTVFGISGGCRGDEIVHIMFGHVTDTGSEIVVRIPESKTYKAKLFPILSKTSIAIIRRYVALRPPDSPTDRFFILQRGNKCFGQPIGKNTIAHMPLKIATFLNLKSPETYTGHSFRRSSTTMAADTGASLMELKRYYYWKSNTVPESKSWHFAIILFLYTFGNSLSGYIQDSLGQKRILAASITKSLDLEPAELPQAKVARLFADNTVDVVPGNSVANDIMPTNAVASEIGQKVNDKNASMVAINDAAAGAVLNIEIDDNSNADMNVDVHSFAHDDKENFVENNVGTVALTQSVCNNEKNVERHSVKLSKCKHFTIKFGNCSK